MARDGGIDHGEGRSAAARLVASVAGQQASLLRELRDEVGEGAEFAAAATRLAGEFGAVGATAVQAAGEGGTALASVDPEVGAAAPPGELPSLYRPGHMRRRLEQLVETNSRYGHPFALAIFDASGPATRDGAPDGPRETVLTILGAALRDSIRVVDEAFGLEEDAICVLAPNLRTVEGVQMAQRLLGDLEDLERAGGMRVALAAGVVACPDHACDADELLHKADAALWRARAVGEPLGVGALEPVQDR